jgi:hypothetical protein
VERSVITSKRGGFAAIGERMTRFDEHDEALRALGLHGLHLDPVEEVSIPLRSAPDVARGRGPAAGKLDLGAIHRKPQLSLRKESLAGLRVYGDPRFDAVVYLEADTPIQLAQATDPAISSHEGTLAVDLERFRGPAYARPTGRDELLELFGSEGGQGLDVKRSEAAAYEPALTADVAAWVGEDPWLAKVVAERLQAGGPLQVALAVGDAWRLRRRTASGERALLEAVLAGRPADALEPERAWALRLDPEARTWLERRGLAFVEQLETTLDDLLELGELDDPSWRSWTLAACRQRDELEGLLLVLQSAGGGQALAPALAALDRQGRSVLGGLRRWPAPADDERLRRAGALDVDSCGVSPVRREG